MIDGILSNKDSHKKCLLFVRDIICDDEAKKKLKDAGYFNKNKIDDTQLEELKKKAKEMLPNHNVFTTKVMNMFYRIYSINHQ